MKISAPIYNHLGTENMCLYKERYRNNHFKDCIILMEIRTQTMEDVFYHVTK